MSADGRTGGARGRGEDARSRGSWNAESGLEHGAPGELRDAEANHDDSREQDAHRSDEDDEEDGSDDGEDQADGASAAAGASSTSHQDVSVEDRWLAETRRAADSALESLGAPAGSITALREMKTLPKNITLEKSRKVLVAAKKLLHERPVFERIVKFAQATLKEGGFKNDELMDVWLAIQVNATRKTPKPSALCAFFPGEFPWAVSESRPNKQPIQVSSAHVASARDGGHNVLDQLAISLRYIFVHVLARDCDELTISEHWWEIIDPSVLTTLRAFLGLPSGEGLDAAAAGARAGPASSNAPPSNATLGATAAVPASNIARRRNPRSREMGNLVVRTAEAALDKRQQCEMVYSLLTMDRRQPAVPQGESPWKLLADVVNDFSFAPRARVDYGLNPTFPPPAPYTPITGPDLRILWREVRKEVGSILSVYEHSSQNASTLDEISANGAPGVHGRGNTQGRGSGAVAGGRSFASLESAARARCSLNPSAIMYLTRLLLEAKYGVQARLSGIIIGRVQGLDDVGSRQTAQQSPIANPVASVAPSSTNAERLRLEADRLEFEKGKLEYKKRRAEAKDRQAEAKQKRLAEGERVSKLLKFEESVHQRLAEARREGDVDSIERYKKLLAQIQENLIQGLSKT